MITVRITAEDDANFLVDYVSFGRLVRRDATVALIDRAREATTEPEKRRLYIAAYQQVGLLLEDLGAGCFALSSRKNNQHTALLQSLLTYDSSEAKISKRLAGNDQHVLKQLGLWPLPLEAYQACWPGETDAKCWAADLVAGLRKLADFQDENWGIYNKLKHGGVVVQSPTIMNPDQVDQGPAVLYRNLRDTTEANAHILYLLPYRELPFCRLVQIADKTSAKLANLVRLAIAIYCSDRLADASS